MIAVTEIRTLDISPGARGTQPAYVSAASGLICVGPTLYVVADDELHLGVFSSSGLAPGYLIRLFDGVLPDDRVERKRRKPDLEALALVPVSRDFPHGALLALGSGSRANRGRGVLLGLDPLGGVCESPLQVDMSPILGPLHDAFAELNIEGAVIVDDELRLFQRGNGRHPSNAIIRYPLSKALDAMRSAAAFTIAPTAINRLDLGVIDNVPLCFTDASALANGDTVFCAVAVGIVGVFRDGPCVGAAIGIVDNAGHLVALQRLERPYKVEGISARQDGDRLDLLLVTDADDPAFPALLLSASIAR
jgi:hypothetical protein